ncbi:MULTISPECIES: hypothetical protein [unclassified Microbacterium]|uniref:hypothetical protein n=1 Tax=unclassified Microbacterium TaxID=2609290 RepID=UPI00386E396F
MTDHEDRRTKAQLLAELNRVVREIDALRASVPRDPVRVPEADALAGCIRSLDTLKGTSSGYSSPNADAVRRTILALCEKYGIQRVEKVTEPCDRRHIEDLSAVDVLTLVKRDFEGYAS